MTGQGERLAIPAAEGRRPGQAAGAGAIAQGRDRPERASAPDGSPATGVARAAAHAAPDAAADQGWLDRVGAWRTMPALPALPRADVDWLRGVGRIGWPGLAVLLFILLLPIHVLVVTVLLNAGLPIALLKALAAWKELTIAAVLLTALRRHGLRLPRGRDLRWPDLCALVFLAEAAIWAALPTEGDLSLVGRLYALRDVAFWTAIYLAARLTPVSARLERAVIVLLVATGAAAGVIGAVERLFVPVEAFVDLGVVRYHNEFLNLYYPTNPFNPAGLPENFFSSFGPQVLRRAVSWHLSAQPFALAYLFVLPATMIVAFTARPEQRRLGFALVVLALFALDLTLTRASIVACIVQFGLLLLFFTRRLLASALTTAGVAVAMAIGAMLLAGWLQVLLPAVTSLPSLWADPDIEERAHAAALARSPTGPLSRIEAAAALRQAVRGEDPSTVGHRSAWATSLSALRERPLFGHGVGTAGQTALRLNRDGTGGESLYFKYTGELGLLGLGAYLGAFLGTLWYGSRQVLRARRAMDLAFPLLVVAAGVGIAVNGISTPLYDVPFMTYVFWWLAGTVVAREVAGIPHHPGGAEAEAAP